MMNKKHFISIIILVLAITLSTTGFYLSHQSKKTERKIPEVRITRGADNYINVYVTRSQIRKEVAPVVIEEFLSQARIISSINGLKLAELKDDSLLARYGFKKGDLVKEIDGQRVNTTEDAVKICEDLGNKLLGSREAKEIKVALNRDGQDLSMNFTIPEFVPEKVNYTLRLEKRGKR